MRATIKVPQKEAPTLSADELKRLADFFSLLIQIDQKDKRKKVLKNGNQ